MKAACIQPFPLSLSLLLLLLVANRLQSPVSMSFREPKHSQCNFILLFSDWDLRWMFFPSFWFLSERLFLTTAGVHAQQNSGNVSSKSSSSNFFQVYALNGNYSYNAVPTRQRRADIGCQFNAKPTMRCFTIQSRVRSRICCWEWAVGWRFKIRPHDDLCQPGPPFANERPFFQFAFSDATSCSKESINQ